MNTTATAPSSTTASTMTRRDRVTLGLLVSAQFLVMLDTSIVNVALPSIRIAPKGEWYDYNAKYVADDTQYLCPGLQGVDEDEIRRIALVAFRAAGCSGWGRVDVMRDAAGNNWLLEVNTAPGMTDVRITLSADTKRPRLRT